MTTHSHLRRLRNLSELDEFYNAEAGCAAAEVTPAARSRTKAVGKEMRHYISQTVLRDEKRLRHAPLKKDVRRILSNAIRAQETS